MNKKWLESLRDITRVDDQFVEKLAELGFVVEFGIYMDWPDKPYITVQNQRVWLVELGEYGGNEVPRNRQQADVIEEINRIMS